MRRVLRVLLALIGLLAVTELALLACVVAFEGRWGETGSADALVVLGARVNPDGAPSDALEKRLVKALSLYEGGCAEYVVVCGGQGSDEPAAEADVMAEYLIARGVPEDRVLRDATSVNTRENLENARALMTARGLSSCVIVTTDYHVARAMWLARDISLDAQGAAAEHSGIVLVKWRLRITETLSWIKYFLTR